MWTTHAPSASGSGRRGRRRSLSQRQLSFSGCSPAYISRIEAGDRIPSLQLLRELGKRLGVSEDYLATGAEARGQTNSLEAELALRFDDLELAAGLYEQMLAEAAAPDARVEPLTGLGRIALSRGQLGEAVRLLEEALATGTRDACELPALAESLGRAYAERGDPSACRRDLRTLRRTFRAEGRPRAQHPLRVPARGNAPRDGECRPGRGARHRRPGDRRADRRLFRSGVALFLPVPCPERRRRRGRGKPLREVGARDARVGRRRPFHGAVAADPRPRGPRKRPAQGRARPLPGRPPAPRVQRLATRAGSFRSRRSARARRARPQGRRHGVGCPRSGAPGRRVTGEAGSVYSLLAEVHAGLGDVARAKELYEQAAELLEQSSPSRALVDVYSQIAELYEAEGRREDAYEYMKKAVGMQQQVAAGRANLGFLRYSWRQSRARPRAPAFHFALQRTRAALMQEAIPHPIVPSEVADGLAADALRAQAWAGEPFLQADENALEALAEGRARRSALDDALQEMDAGRRAPSPEWKVRYALMLGLERVITDHPPRLASGTELRRHQIDALAGMLTELISNIEHPAENGGPRRGPRTAWSTRRLRQATRRSLCSRPTRSTMTTSTSPLRAVIRAPSAASGSGIRPRRARRSPRVASSRRPGRWAS